MFETFNPATRSRTPEAFPYFHNSLNYLFPTPYNSHSLFFNHPLKPQMARSNAKIMPSLVRCSASPDSDPAGEVHVIIGPMFAGKTTALLRRVKSESDTGRTVAMIKSSKDDRYAVDAVVTHDGVKFPCLCLSQLSSLKHELGASAYDKLEVIGIDEAQFFDDLYDFCCEAADVDGKIVIVAGLDGDYLRRSFGSVLGVVPLADTVTKLTARCEICRKRAFFTLRKTQETKTELIGGADLYMPVCRQHYVSLHKDAAEPVKEAIPVEALAV